MEDIQAYIKSGILELYVLGDVTPVEQRQVEKMASKYPEIKTELDSIAHSMELYAKEHQVEPSENLRGRVLGSLLTNFGDDRNFAAAPHHEEIETEEDEEEDNIDQEDNIANLPSPKENNYYKYAFAASFTLLIASTIALVSIYGKLQDSNNQLVAMQQDKQHFANRVNLMNKELTVFRDTSYKLIHLKGTAKTPSSLVTVAFSSGQKKVVIDMANMKMPENDKEHQYQLWALVGGKPVNLGVFDAARDTVTDIKEMKPIAFADAFAVTLEPRGGSINPTMGQMMVLGKY